MKVPIEKPGTPEELVHFGVKGMRWGIRKEDLVTSSRSSKKMNVAGSEKFSKENAVSMNNFATKLAKSYGYKVDEFVPLSKKEEKKGYLAYVDVSRKDNKHVIHVSNDPKFKETLLDLQKKGWLVPTTPSKAIEANLTHEASHAIFHTSEVSGRVFKKYTPELMESSRENAWTKAKAQALKDGDIKPRTLAQKLTLRNIPETEMAKKLSQYAEKSLFLEETEAEMFAAYHWSPNPPKFVDTFVTSVHKDIGKDIAPFSGRKVSHA